VAKFGDSGQRHHHMPVGAGSHVIDEIDQAIFQTPGVKSVDNVNDRWNTAKLGRCNHASRRTANACRVRQLKLDLPRWSVNQPHSSFQPSAAPASKTPDPVAGASQVFGIKRRLHIDEGPALDQHLAKVFDAE
jgi:hypothetical protein